MRSWINSTTSQEEGPKPQLEPRPENAAATDKALDLEDQLERSGSVVVKQIVSGLRQLQAALTSGRELLKTELDLLKLELSSPQPEKGILHKAVAIMRGKITEKGEVVLSNAGWALLARVDELIDYLPEGE